MATSLIDRVNRVGATKSYYGYGFPGDSWITQSLARQNVDLQDSQYDYALAYLYVEPIRVCIDLYAQAAARIPYVLYRGETPVARSDDVIARHDLMAMLRSHRKRYYIGFFQALIYELVMHDQMVVEMIQPPLEYVRMNPLSDKDVIGLRVLRGTATTLSFMRGSLESVSFSGDDGSGTIPVKNIIYDKGYNPLSDYYGASRMQSVLDETNIINRLRRWLMRFLIKADRPDVYASLKNGTNDQNAWEQTKKALREYMQDESRTMFGGSLPMDFASIPRPDANNQLDIDDKTRASIFRGFRVHPALAGDTQGTSYKQEHGAIYSNWVKNELAPMLVQVDEVINDVLIPRAFADEEGLRLEHDISEFEIVTDDDKSRIEAANMQLDSGGVTYGRYYDLIGKPDECPEELKDAIKIEGIPVFLSEVPNLVKYKFQAPASADFAQADKDSTEADIMPEEVAQDNETPEPDAIAGMLPSGRVKQDVKSVDIEHGDHVHSIGIKAFNPAQASPADELKAWRKVSLKSAGKRDFEPAWLRGDIGDMLQDAIKSARGNQEIIAKAFERAHYEVLAQSKSIQATRLDFEYDFETLLKKARDDYNTFGRVQWSSAMRAIIRRYGTKAYIDGLADGGVQGELSEEDETRIAEIVREQSQYVTNLGQEIFKTEAGISDALSQQKPAMWYRKSIEPFYHEGRVSADANAMMEFAGNDGLESCPTCTRLKGQRHRYRTWKRKGLIPKVDTDNYDCGGFQCEHLLVKVNATARGRFVSGKSFPVKWSEADHPRGDDGKFGSGGGSSSGGGDKPTGDSGSNPPSWSQSKQRFISKDGDHMDYGHMDGNPANAMADMREKNMSQNHTSKLDSTQKQAVQTYTGETYKDINKGLRGKGELSPENQKTIKDLDSAIGANSLDEPTVLYRGVKLNDSMRESMKPGSTFTDKAYTSTSLDQSNPERFAGGDGGAVMRIKAPKGQNGMAASSLSEYPEEREFLLPRNTQYKINSVSVDPDTGKTYIDAEIIGGG